MRCPTKLTLKKRGTPFQKRSLIVTHFPRVWHKKIVAHTFSLKFSLSKRIYEVIRVSDTRRKPEDLVITLLLTEIPQDGISNVKNCHNLTKALWDRKMMKVCLESIEGTIIICFFFDIFRTLLKRFWTKSLIFTM